MNSTCNGNRQTRRSERGTQIVEFALALPFLVLLSMVILEGGSFVRIHQVLNNAAREGARVATTPNNDKFIDSGTHHNLLGESAACNYLMQNKSVFPGWSGTSCTDPFSVRVEVVQPGDPDQIVVTDPVSGATVFIASTRAVVQYGYDLRYMPLAVFFSWQSTTLTLQGRAQFRNLY